MDVDVGSVVAVASAGRGIFSDLLRLAKKRGDAEITEKLADAQLKFLELVNAQSEGQEEIRRLRGELRELEAKLRDKRRLTIRENAYWDEETGEGPYCSACFDSKQRTVRMHVDGGQYRCPSCSVVVVTEAERRRIDAMVPNLSADWDPLGRY